jgi:hypothetical protein
MSYLWTFLAFGLSVPCFGKAIICWIERNR